MNARKKVVVSLLFLSFFFTAQPFPSLSLESRNATNYTDFSVYNTAQNTLFGSGALGLALFTAKCIKSFFTSTSTQFGAHVHAVTEQFFSSFALRDKTLSNFFSCALRANSTGIDALVARLKIINFDTSTIASSYRSLIETIKQQLVNVYCADDGKLLPAQPTDQLGAIFDPFVRTYFDHDEYMVALNAIGDSSARDIFDYHHASPFGHAVRGTGLAINKIQSALSSSRCSIAQAMQHPYNQALQKIVDCCQNNQFDQARAHLIPGDQLMQSIYDHYHAPLRAQQYNESGILRAHETDSLWKQLTPQAQTQLGHNPLQRESFNKLLAQRELYRSFVYERYGIDRVHCAPQLRQTIEEMVDLQTTLQFNIRSGIDFMLFKAEEPSVARTFFDSQSGILNDFKADPLVWQLNLDRADLAHHPDELHLAHYFLAVRATNAPESAQQLATNGLETIAIQLNGQSVRTDALTIFDQLCEQFPQVVGADYHEHLVNTQEFHHIVEHVHEMPFTSQEHHEWEVACDRFQRDGDFKINQNFAITNEGKILLLESKISAPHYEFIRGNSLQRELHKNFVININEFGALHANPRYKNTAEFHINLAHLNQAGVEKTKQNEIKTGLNILFICKQGVQYVKAVALGVADGAVLAAQDIKNNPLGFAASAVVQLYAGSTLVTYQVLKAAYDVGGIAAEKLSEINFQDLTVAGVVDSLKQVGVHFAERLQHIPSPDAVRKAVATGTHIYLDYKATKAVANLYKHALNTTKLAVIKLNTMSKKSALTVQAADGTKITIAKGSNYQIISDVPTKKIVTYTPVQTGKREIVLARVKTYEQARNKALEIIGKVDPHAGNPHIGTLGVGEGLIVGRRWYGKKVILRLDYDDVKGPHINVTDYRDGKGTLGTVVAIPFEGNELTVKNLLKHFQR
ncbi:MAG: hypothetical protein BWY54_00610 [Candidatus Dependentiae bacterium ADurb.Bin331]|nr:MAG: hypothetical protein BWY54_00610 [Candidatus Dependentiae bacterium ADurb.Bin331]